MRSVFKSLILISSLMSINALASADIDALEKRGCLLKLTKEQRVNLVKISKEAALQSKEIRVDLVKARKELRKSLLEQNITKEEIKLLSGAVTEKQHALEAIRKATRLDVMFDVLSPEQRIKMTKCERLKRPMRSRLNQRRPHRMERRQIRPHVRRHLPRHHHHRPHHRPHRRGNGGGPRPTV